MILRHSFFYTCTLAPSLIFTNASPLSPINITTPVTPTSGSVKYLIPLYPIDDLFLAIQSHTPTASPLDTNKVPGFITAASLNLYALLHDGALPRGPATPFQHTYSYRSRSTGYRLLFWGGDFRRYGVSYGDLMAGMQGLMSVASGLFEEVDLEIGFVDRGLWPVAGRLSKEVVGGVGGVGVGGDGDGNWGAAGVDVA